MNERTLLREILEEVERSVLAARSKGHTLDHDLQHTSDEFVSLVTRYAAAGRWEDAAGVCVGAAMAEAVRARLGRGAR